MIEDNTTVLLVTMTASPGGIQTANLISGILFFLTFLFGVVINSLFIWVLGFRLKKSVNTIWFFHLIVVNGIFTALLPFLGIYFFMDSHWNLGVVLCKVVNALISLCMFTSVFLLTIISVDRYLLIFRPLWYRSRRTTGCASAISISIWFLSLLLSTPYLVFRDTRVIGRNKTICCNNYALSADWENPEVQKRREVVHWSMFILRVLLGFLLPFLVITFCYLMIAVKMKMKSLTKSRKPFKVILAAILSFFVCWTPYHVHYGMSLHKEHISEEAIQAVSVFSCSLICINSCFTPILYLCVGENFKRVFKKSILALFESAFNENFNSSEHNEDRLEASSSFVKVLL